MTTPSDLVEFFRSHLDYDSESGAFRWKNQSVGGGKKRLGWFHVPKNTNNNFIIHIDSKQFNARTVAWMIHNGVEPVGEVRTIEGDSLAISNLEEFVAPLRGKRDFDREFLSQFLEYDPVAGLFRWKKKTSAACVDGWFIPKSKQRSHCEGEAQGSIKVFGHSYACTHLAWLLYWGVWPQYEIDHIDGNNQNQKIDNLRDVTHVVNMQNIKLKKTNRTGVPNVYVHKRTGRFVVEFYVNGKTRNFGFHKTIEEASAAREKACKELGFHENHGKYRQ